MTRWKYDADQKDPLVKLRIPVTSMFPDWHYTACFDKESAVRPTEAEAWAIASFIRYRQERLIGGGWWRRRYDNEPFDLLIPSQEQTVVLHKWGHDDWSYRRVIWAAGPHWSPVSPRLRGTAKDDGQLSGPAPLDRVLNRINDAAAGGRDLPWREWKLARPKVFPHPQGERNDRHNA